MLEDFLPAIKLQIKISRLFACIPYKWDSKSCRLIFETSKGYLKVYKIGRLIHALYASFMMSSFIHMWMTKEGEGISVAQVLSIGWICCHIGGGVLRLGVAHKMNDLLRLVNSFVEFEAALTKEVKERTVGQKLIKMLCYFGCCASLGMPTFINLMLANQPCLPPMMGYSLFSCNENLQLINPSTKVQVMKYFVLLFNICTWYNAFGMAYFLIFPAFYLPMICLKEYSQTLKAVLLRHAENKRNAQVRVLTKQRQRVQVVMIYRRMQLLCLQFNECYAGVFLPVTLVACLISAITSLFVAIRLHNVLPLEGLGFFMLNLSILSIMFNFVFGFGGCIYVSSLDLQENMNKVEGLNRLRWFRKAICSFTPLKIKCGNLGGYIDELTPLVLNGFAIEQTVSLILIAG